MRLRLHRLEEGGMKRLCVVGAGTARRLRAVSQRARFYISPGS